MLTQAEVGARGLADDHAVRRGALDAWRDGVHNLMKLMSPIRCYIRQRMPLKKTVTRTPSDGNPCFLALSALEPVLFYAVVYAFMSSSARGTSIAILMLSMLSHINPRYNCEPSVARCIRYKYKRYQTSPFVVYVILIDLLIELVLPDR